MIYTPSGLPCSGKDQMGKILSILGTPNEEDTSFITDNKAIEYIQTFPKCKRIELSVKYPTATPEVIDFMNKLLVFNPFFRMTALEAIQCKVFDSVRNVKKESIIQQISKSAIHDIKLEVDRDDAFDYENTSNAKFSVDDLKSILAKEIKEI